MISTPIREAMLQAGFVHRDGPYAGRPNVRRFANAMIQHDGTSDREVMERNIRRWIDEENPTSPSEHMREVAAGVFQQHGVELTPDELRLKPAVEALLARRQETDAAIEELTRVVGLLAQQVQELQHHVGALLREAGGPPPQP